MKCNQMLNQLTQELIHGKKIPQIKRPSNGPPTIPNILNIICNYNKHKTYLTVYMSNTMGVL